MRGGGGHGWWGVLEQPTDDGINKIRVPLKGMAHSWDELLRLWITTKVNLKIPRGTKQQEADHLEAQICNRYPQSCWKSVVTMRGSNLKHQKIPQAAGGLTSAPAPAKPVDTSSATKSPAAAKSGRSAGCCGGGRVR